MKPSALQELRDEVEDLSAELSGTLGHSPLGSVAERLIRFLEGVVCAVDNGHRPEQLRESIAFVQRIKHALPNSFGRRFDFDVAVIASVLSSWAKSGARVSAFTIPRYTGSWGYYRIVMPPEDLERAQVVRVVAFPGADRLSDVDLSDYAWLIHELAHDAFYQPSHRFREVLESRIRGRLRQLAARASADTGVAARRSAHHVEALAGYWMPRADQLGAC